MKLLGNVIKQSLGFMYYLTGSLPPSLSLMPLSVLLSMLVSEHLVHLLYSDSLIKASTLQLRVSLDVGSTLVGDQ